MLQGLAGELGITAALGDDRQGKLALWQVIARSSKIQSLAQEVCTFELNLHEDHRHHFRSGVHAKVAVENSSVDCGLITPAVWPKSVERQRGRIV